MQQATVICDWAMWVLPLVYCLISFACCDVLLCLRELTIFFLDLALGNYQLGKGSFRDMALTNPKQG